ncbi:MAG: SRPBCC family protein [Planctomycetales bacterium]|nr:SRPBCC family protein [Planctomycetales bacterium]
MTDESQARPRRKLWKFFVYPLAALAVLALGLVVLVALQPSGFSVSRSAVIDAPPEVVFPLVNDLHLWQKWSPWAKLDPNAKNMFKGPEAGTGAEFHWDGNSDIGEGIMTITASDPMTRVAMRLKFIRPYEDECNVEFAFSPAESGKTKVVWSMQGENDFFGKAMCMCMDMDAMVGGDFEKGLKNLADAAAKHQAAD